MKTKAAVLVAQNAPLEIMELEVPPLDVGQVLVRVAYSGICGKQLDEISGKRGPDPFLPHLLGHEGSGTVEAVGPGVRKVAPDDHVVLHWMKGSGIDSIPPRFRLDGRTVSAGWVTTFNEYAVVSENRLTSVPGDLPLDLAALFGCAVTTGLGIVFNDIGLKPGQSIAVFGVGGVGVNVVQGAALVNAHPIVAVDQQDAQLRQAREFGATHEVNSNRVDLRQVLGDIVGVSGFDAVVDCTGSAEVIQLGYEMTCPTGKTILAGVPGHQTRVLIDSFHLHFGKKISGSHGGGTNPDRDIPRYADIHKLGRLKLREAITHRSTLVEINATLERCRRGQPGRCIVGLNP